MVGQGKLPCTISFKEEIVARIDELARKNQWSRAHQIRYFVEEAFARIDAKAAPGFSPAKTEPKKIEEESAKTKPSTNLFDLPYVK